MRRTPADLLFDVHTKSYWLRETRPVSLDKKLSMDLMKWMYNNLKSKYYQVMKAIYFQGKTMPEAGKILGITRERVRQINNLSLRRLRSAEKVLELNKIIFGDKDGIM